MPIWLTAGIGQSQLSAGGPYGPRNGRSQLGWGAGVLVWGQKLQNVRSQGFGLPIGLFDCLAAVVMVTVREEGVFGP